MPVRTRKTKGGKFVVVDAKGKVKTRPMTKARATARVHAENLAVMRKRRRRR